MKKIISIFALFVFVFPAFVLADEYVLVMSKDDNVCQHIEKIYNADLRKYGKVKYDAHDDFKTVKWAKKKYYRSVDGEKEYPVYPYATSTTVLMSRFDINNDGKDEIVIKQEGMLHSIVTEGLFYFKDEASAYFNSEEGFDIKILYDKAAGRVGSGIGFEGNAYELKGLPQVSIGMILDKEAYSHYIVGGHFYINPFRYRDMYYIDMNDEVPNDKYRIYSGKFLIILKFTEDNQLNDMCYFLKTLKCDKSKGVK